MALAAKYQGMAFILDRKLADDDWKTMRVTHEHAIKLADCIEQGLVDTLSRGGKACLTEAYNAAIRDGFIAPDLLKKLKL